MIARLDSKIGRWRCRQKCPPWADAVEKVFWGNKRTFPGLPIRLGRSDVRDHRFSEKRPRTFVSALLSIATAEWPKNQHLRDFWLRSIFNSFDSIGQRLRRIAASGVQVAVGGRVNILINPEQVAGIVFPLHLDKPLIIVVRGRLHARLTLVVHHEVGVGAGKIERMDGVPSGSRPLFQGRGHR
jgi:hypothetical protein